MARQHPRTVPIAASTGAPSPWSQRMPGAVTRTAWAVTRTAWAVTRTAWAVTRFTSVTRHEIFDRVFDLLAGVLGSFAWSALPLFSVLLSPVILPTASWALPASSGSCSSPYPYRSPCLLLPSGSRPVWPTSRTSWVTSWAGRQTSERVGTGTGRRREPRTDPARHLGRVS